MVRGCPQSWPSFPSKTSYSPPALIWRMSLDLDYWPSLKAVSKPEGLIYLHCDPWHRFLLETSSAAHMVTKTRAWSLMIGPCHLVQIRVGPQAPWFCIFLILWGKVELTDWRPSISQRAVFILPTVLRTSLPSPSRTNYATSYPEEEAEPSVPTVMLSAAITIMLKIILKQLYKYSCCEKFKSSHELFIFFKIWKQSRYNMNGRCSCR